VRSQQLLLSFYRCSYLLVSDAPHGLKGPTGVKKTETPFVSYENRNVQGSLRFGTLIGEQLKDRGLQYARHYTQEFMGRHRRELLDADDGVYRYDQLEVLRGTKMPAVLLEAGSIINRDEEILMNSPGHRALISAAVTTAVEMFCDAPSLRSK
jgi:N-acetylmuramoyl-L-alanine amidase